MNLIQEFQKRASAAGLSAEQITAFINTNGLAAKVAEPTVEDVLSQICEAANVEKSAEALAYAEGFFIKGAESGLSPEQAVVVTKQALARTFPAKVVAPAEKQAGAQVDPAQEAYITGLYEKAAALGFTPEQTTAFLQKAAAPGGSAVGAFTGNLARQAGGGGAAGKVVGLSPLGKILGGLGAGGAALGGAHMAGAFDKPGIGEQLLQFIKQNPEAAGGIGGAGLGALAGGVSGLPGDADPNNPEAGQSHVGRNALLGALAGGGVGAGAGHFAPDMFKRLAA